MWARQGIDGRGWREEWEVESEVIIISKTIKWNDKGSEWVKLWSCCPSFTSPSIVTRLTVCQCPFSALCYPMSSFLWLLSVFIPCSLKCSFNPSCRLVRASLYPAQPATGFGCLPRFLITGCLLSKTLGRWPAWRHTTLRTSHFLSYL